MIQIRSFVAAYLLTSSRAFSPTRSSIPNIRNANTRKQHSHLYASDAEDDRRSFLTKGAGIALVLGVGFAFQSKFPSPPGAPPSSVDFKAVAADISGIVSNDKDKGPTMVRLAWHSSGTYDKMTKSGGSGAGTMYFKEELDHGANAGLAQTAVAWLEPIKKTYGDGLSYADLYTLCGGKLSITCKRSNLDSMLCSTVILPGTYLYTLHFKVAAIKELGGPTIPWSSGRVDALDPSAVAPDGRLPNADSGEPGANPDDAAHLRTVFGRMGFNDQEIVALSGAHALGRCHPNFSGYEGMLHLAVDYHFLLLFVGVAFKPLQMCINFSYWCT